jgi:hypothetical protein
MTNPCDDCIVDAMCLNPCKIFINFMNYFSSCHPSFFLCQLYNLVDTGVRFKRSRNCVVYNQLSYNLYVKLDNFRMKLSLQRGKLK